MIRVLVVDDHPLFRHGLAGMLGIADDMELVDAVGDAETAVRRCAELEPDVVLMDLNLPGMPGVEGIRQIAAQERPPAVQRCAAGVFASSSGPANCISRRAAEPQSRRAAEPQRSTPQ